VRARAYDCGKLLINLLFSMSVILLPFSSALIGEHESQQPTAIVHAPNTHLVGLRLTWLCWDVSKEGQHVEKTSIGG
jgi:uncharacterized membrane protein